VASDECSTNKTAQILGIAIGKPELDRVRAISIAKAYLKKIRSTNIISQSNIIEKTITLLLNITIIM
jgi:hypothetical protein